MCPLTRYGNTYWDVMLEPIFKAVQEVYTKPGKTIIFGPEGEMGGTVFFAPRSYQKIVDRVRAEYKGPAKLDIALMFNHAFIAGVINRGADPAADRAGPPSPLDAYQGWGPVLPLAQWRNSPRLRAVLPEMLRLLNSVDVLGVSCYPRAGADPQPSEIESCASKVDAELTALGFNLKAWLGADPARRFILNEIGLGGGISRCGDTPSRTRAEAGRFPHLDVGYPWSIKNDPWSRPELRVRVRRYGVGSSGWGQLSPRQGGLAGPFCATGSAICQQPGRRRPPRHLPCHSLGMGPHILAVRRAAWRPPSPFLSAAISARLARSRAQAAVDRRPELPHFRSLPMEPGVHGPTGAWMGPAHPRPGRSVWGPLPRRCGTGAGHPVIAPSPSGASCLHSCSLPGVPTKCSTDPAVARPTCPRTPGHPSRHHRQRRLLQGASVARRHRSPAHSAPKLVASWECPVAAARWGFVVCRAPARTSCRNLLAHP
jgi:hypothetical protein